MGIVTQFGSDGMIQPGSVKVEGPVREIGAFDVVLKLATFFWCRVLGIGAGASHRLNMYSITELTLPALVLDLSF